MVRSLPIGRSSSGVPFDYPDLSKHVTSNGVHAVEQLVHVLCHVILLQATLSVSMVRIVMADFEQLSAPYTRYLLQATC